MLSSSFFPFSSISNFWLPGGSDQKQHCVKRTQGTNLPWKHIWLANAVLCQKTWHCVEAKVHFLGGWGWGGGSIQLTEEAMFSHTVLFVCLNMAKVMWGPVLPQSPFTHALNSIFLLKGWQFFFFLKWGLKKYGWKTNAYVTKDLLFLFTICSYFLSQYVKFLVG